MPAIVSEEFLDDLLHAGHREQWARGDFADMWPDGAYRSGWYTPHLDPDVALGVGIYGQMLYVDVPRQVVVGDAVVLVAARRRRLARRQPHDLPHAGPPRRGLIATTGNG